MPRPGDRKGTKYKRLTPKKRKFHGNRYTTRSSDDGSSINESTGDVDLNETDDNGVNMDASITNKSLRSLPKDQLISLIIKCTDFAARKHSKQRRLDSEATPYINHPIGVANILTQEGDVSDPVIIMAAILHDTVEDTDTTFDEIESEFGSEVRLVVSEVTDDKSLPKDERKRLQIEHSPHISREAKQVKLADKIYNLRDLQRCIPIDWTPQRVEEYFSWSQKVIDGCRGVNEKLEKVFDDVISKQMGQSKE